MQYKNKQKPSQQLIKKQKPKPQWTTDFIDRQQYKLTQAQRIQKKAALQSKHRQQAKRQLQQRRKKLQMGIIDQQTRKVYQTALISKNIDINPPLRRNLTQMIRYEKQQKDKMYSNQEGQNDEQNEEDWNQSDQQQKQIKEAQQFIKKFQKAKKQQKIQRAVQILTNNKSLQKTKKQNSNQIQIKNNNFFDRSNQTKSYKSKKQSEKSYKNSQSFSQDDALSSIEDTIRFMQQKLFVAKKTFQQNSKSFISEQNQINQNEKDKTLDWEQNYKEKQQKQGFKKENKQKNEEEKKKQKNEEIVNFKTSNNKISNQQLQFGNKIGQISQLRIKIKDENSSQSGDQCLDTIRRMRQLMENNQNEEQNIVTHNYKINMKNNGTPSVGTLGFNSTISKRSYESGLESDAEVSFNLTVNNDDEWNSQIMNLSQSKFRNTNQLMSKKQVINKKEQKPNNLNKNNLNTNNLNNKNKNKNEDNKYGFKKDKNKQDLYEDQYQKIKQNLFACINSNIEQPKQNYMKTTFQTNNNLIKYNQDDEDQEDSFVITDKINSWKKQLEHQIDPDEDEEVIQIHNSNPKIFNQKANKQVFKYKQDKQDSSQEEQSYYKQTYLSHKNQNMNSLNQIQFKLPSNNLKSQNNLKQQNKFVQMNKKPPIVKKGKKDQKLQQIKKMISSASSSIQQIQIQPLKIQPLNGSRQVLGFDFRGSINIKKNVVSK